jgi:hypothetical protein
VPVLVDVGEPVALELGAPSSVAPDPPSPGAGDDAPVVVAHDGDDEADPPAPEPVVADVDESSPHAPTVDARIRNAESSSRRARRDVIAGSRRAGRDPLPMLDEATSATFSSP